MTYRGNSIESLVLTGDEMNIHTPQSLEAEVELRYLPNIKNHIITAQESKPIITITQDALVGVYLMTRDDMPLTKSQFNDISFTGERPDGSLLYNPEKIKQITKILRAHKKKPNFQTSRGLISLILPEDLNYEKENKAHLTEPKVIIKQGVFIEGAFDKSTLGSANGSLIQILNKEYGADITANFIDNIQFIANAWLLVQGFSIGLEDCMITSEKSVNAINDSLAQCYTKAQGIEETTQNPGIREIRVTASLSQARDMGMKIARDAMGKNNNLKTAVNSGAKGDYFNIAQITGSLGQQNLEGHRVMPSLNHGKRTLPHYPFSGMSKEREYESRGFVRNSFIHGLSPEEFFFHAMSGREGVADTALGTAKSGYTQRKIIKVCEDIQIQYDRTVRDATGKIYQFSYGQTGADATKTVMVDGIPQVCDIRRLTEKLNTQYENEIAEVKTQKDPEIEISVYKPDTRSVSGMEKDRTVTRIQKILSNTTVNSSWSIEELSQRMEALKDEELRGKELDRLEELENLEDISEEDGEDDLDTEESGDEEKTEIETEAEELENLEIEDESENSDFQVEEELSEDDFEEDKGDVGGDFD